jgi:hypothetical protein
LFIENLLKVNETGQSACVLVFYVTDAVCSFMWGKMNQTISVAPEPECSLPHSQQPAAGPYPEPVEFNELETFP